MHICTQDERKKSTYAYRINKKGHICTQDGWRKSIYAQPVAYTRIGVDDQEGSVKLSIFQVLIVNDTLSQQVVVNVFIHFDIGGPGLFRGLVCILMIRQTSNRVLLFVIRLVEALCIVVFCHNNQQNRTTGKTAFETVYRLHPRWEMADEVVGAPAAEDFGGRMEKVWDEVKASMELHKSKAVEGLKEFKVGDRVYLATPNIKTRWPRRSWTTGGSAHSQSPNKSPLTHIA